jgi:hypothetical protein
MPGILEKKKNMRKDSRSIYSYREHSVEIPRDYYCLPIISAAVHSTRENLALVTFECSSVGDFSSSAEMRVDWGEKNKYYIFYNFYI